MKLRKILLLTFLFVAFSFLFSCSSKDKLNNTVWVGEYSKGYWEAYAFSDSGSTVYRGWCVGKNSAVNYAKNARNGSGKASNSEKISYSYANGVGKMEGGNGRKHVVDFTINGNVMNSTGSYKFDLTKVE